MKIMKYTIYLLALIILLSCQEKLDLPPLESLSAAQIFENDENIQLYVNGFYRNVPSASSVTGQTNSNPDPDILSDIRAWSQNIQYISGNFTSHDVKGWNWSQLRNINYFLSHIKDANIESSRKDHYIGIAKFFRAWFYFQKVKDFGEVPWFSRALDPDDPEVYKSRDTRLMVMDSVFADINYAVENIDDAKDNSCSKVTKWVALALKSRICLFEGTFRKYHTGTGFSETSKIWLEESVKASSELMRSGEYELHNTGNPSKDYRDLFINEVPLNDEIILAKIYSKQYNIFHSTTKSFSNTWNYQYFLTNRFINTYLNLDGSRFTDLPNYKSMLFNEETENRDHRLSQTIRTPKYIRSDGSTVPPFLGMARTGYQVIKFSLDDPAYDDNNESYNSIPIFRYGEVLLNYAEAKAELDDFTVSDWEISISKLRDRAGIENTSIPNEMDTYLVNNFYGNINSIELLEIRRERTIELISEGFRFDDLKRWKAADLLEMEKDGIYVPQMNELMDLNDDGQFDVMFTEKRPDEVLPHVYYYIIDNVATKLSNGKYGNIIWQSNISREFQDFKYFLPLPYNELIINRNLEQNDGWDHP